MRTDAVGPGAARRREVAGRVSPGEGQGVMRTVHPGPMSDNEPALTTAGGTIFSLFLSLPFSFSWSFVSSRP